jgi:hypothetical protein
MKEEKESQLDAVKDELNHKIEKIMGPSPQKKPAEGKELYEQDNSENASKAEPKSSNDDLAEIKDPYPEHKPKQPAGAEGAVPGWLNDPDLDKAVDDIATKEGDELLAVEDEAIEEAYSKDEKKPTILSKIKNFFADPKKRWTVIIIVGLLITAVLAVPNSRYFVLNKAGVRSSASLKVLDESTQQPLKNVAVTLNGQSGITDDEGVVKLSRLKLGRSDLKIERVAFATITKSITVGWGSNPLGDFKLTPVGLQYSFHVVDFLSGTAIQKAEAISGTASAFSDEKGEILLTLDSKTEDKVSVTIKAEGYRDETLIASSDDTANKDIKMVPARKHVFVSKRTGKFDVYKIDADGKNEELVLRGTGSERDDMVLTPNPTKNIAALVSTRENMHNSSGYMLSTLYILSLDTNDKKSLGRSEKFQILGWIDDKLIYVQIAAAGSADNPKRQRLISYDTVTGNSVEIATSNYFNDVLVAQNKVYYAPSDTYQGGVNVSLFSADGDGNNRNVLINNEAWNIFRTAYSELTITVGEAWYQYKIGGTEGPQALNGEPANPTSRIYIDSPDKKHSLWVDQRDGKGVLLAYDTEKHEDRNLVSHSGLTNPVRWLNDSTIVYRVKNDNETADYLINVNGGEPRKLIDVTNTSGITRWYYY